MGDGVDTVNDSQADNNIFRFGAGVNKDNIKLRLAGGNDFLDGGSQADRLSAALTAKKSASFTQRRKFQQRSGRQFQGRRTSEIFALPACLDRIY